MASVQTNVIQVEFRTEGVEQVLFISGTPVLAFPHPPELGPANNQEVIPSVLEALDGWEYSFDTSLFHLSTLIYHLESFQKSRIAYRDRICTRRSLWRQFPREILLEIFGYASLSGVNSSEMLHQDGGMRWRLGQVCSYWRQISRECPLLWTNLCIDSFEAERCKEPVLLLETALSLSDGLPIRLFLRNFDQGESWDRPLRRDYIPQIHTDILALLVEQSGRWLSLDISNFSVFIFTHLSSIRQRLPQLRKLSLGADMLPPIDVSGLHHVRIMVRDRDNRTPDRLAMGVDLVRRCPQLRTFSLAETHQFPSSWNPPSVSAAAHITSSHLIDLSTSDLSLIYYLRLPNLQTLTVCLPFLHGSPTGSPTLHGLEAIRALLKNSRCSLLSLKLEDVPLSLKLLQDIFSMTPSLRDLDISFRVAWSYEELYMSRTFVDITEVCLGLFQHLEEVVTRRRRPAGLSNVWRGELSENDELELEEEEDEDDEDEEDEDLPFLHLPVLQSFRLAVPGARFYNFVAPGARGLHDYQAVQVVMGSTFLRMAEARGGRGCTLCLNVGGEVALLTVEDENALRGAVEDGLDIAILRGGLRK
ncbi:hypothetical protein BDZ89DRAFT_1142965 [Hymenopellis radicata]|nr:hypothetical protein BDZ89DRAFT_1142965 [Hymenopellis radicata]